ncbi:hypothetical protein TYRP_001398 [Tyrophagus putrescentiae]|nr:hypothetical protein TYRP_001398 [Tyrophagus putrescentiae]
MFTEQWIHLGQAQDDVSQALAVAGFHAQQRSGAAFRDDGARVGVSQCCGGGPARWKGNFEEASIGIDVHRGRRSPSPARHLNGLRAVVERGKGRNRVSQGSSILQRLRLQLLTAVSSVGRVQEIGGSGGSIVIDPLGSNGRRPFAPHLHLLNGRLQLRQIAANAGGGHLIALQITLHLLNERRPLAVRLDRHLVSLCSKGTSIE